MKYTTSIYKIEFVIEFYSYFYFPKQIGAVLDQDPCKNLDFFVLFYLVMNLCS